MGSDSPFRGARGLRSREAGRDQGRILCLHVLFGRVSPPPISKVGGSGLPRTRAQTRVGSGPPLLPAPLRSRAGGGAPSSACNGSERMNGATWGRRAVGGSHRLPAHGLREHSTLTPFRSPETRPQVERPRDVPGSSLSPRSLRPADPEGSQRAGRWGWSPERGGGAPLRRPPRQASVLLPSFG